MEVEDGKNNKDTQDIVEIEAVISDTDFTANPNKEYEFKKTDKLTDKKNRRKFSFDQVLVLVIIFAIVFGAFTGSSLAIFSNLFYNTEGKINNEKNYQVQATLPTEMFSQNNPWANVYQNLAGSVVSITSKIDIFTGFFNIVKEQEGSGSGVIFSVDDEKILILTNNHVVEGTKEIRVSFTPNVTAKAKVLGKDVEGDLAIIEVIKKNIPNLSQITITVAAFGDSDKTAIGEFVAAIGNPLGYDDSMALGVISAKDRDLEMADSNLKLLQTDAAINPGNSGGALVNINSEVIGINTAKLYGSEIEGMGFAIPSNYAKGFIDDILEKGYVSRPYLGVSGQVITKEQAIEFDIPEGILITKVYEGSPAEKNGIRRGDIIIEGDGKEIKSIEQLSEVIAKRKVGDEIKLKISRENETDLELSVKLSEKPVNNKTAP